MQQFERYFFVLLLLFYAFELEKSDLDQKLPSTNNLVLEAIFGKSAYLWTNFVVHLY